MKNWRVINNNMIQTYNKHVWLWDDSTGVAVLVPVTSRPWKKIDPDFSHWMAGEEGESPPRFPPDGAKKWSPEQMQEMISGVAIDNLKTTFPIASFAFVTDDEDDDLDWDDDDE